MNRMPKEARQGHRRAPSGPRAPAFGTIGIVGLGLIGGSLALALRRAWPSVVIVGVDRGAVIRKALALGAIDRGSSRLAALSGVELVVLAAPVEENIRLLGRLGVILRETAIVTDVGSTKRVIVRAAARRRRLVFVGGHPMAGTARSGIDAADPDLFRGRRWVLTTDTGNALAVRRVVALVRAVGAEPVMLPAEDHDRFVAFVSHLPQVVASVLMRVVGDAVGASGLSLAGPGLRDTTRLAASQPAMWQDISRTNPDYISEALTRLLEALAALTDPRDLAQALGSVFKSAIAWRAVLEHDRLAVRRVRSVAPPPALRR
jgi:prephenate dehydrogenase